MATLEAYGSKKKKKQTVGKEERLLSIYQQYQKDPSKLNALDSLYWELNAPKNFKDAIRLAPKTKNQISPQDSASALIEKSLDQGISPEESLYVSKFAKTEGLRKQFDTKAISKKKQEEKQSRQEKRSSQIKNYEKDINNLVKTIDKYTDSQGNPFPDKKTLVRTSKARKEQLQDDLRKIDPTNPLIELKIDEVPADTTNIFDKVKDKTVDAISAFKEKGQQAQAFQTNRDILYNLEFQKTGSREKASAFQKKWQELLQSRTIITNAQGQKAIYIGGDPSKSTSFMVVK